MLELAGSAALDQVSGSHRFERFVTVEEVYNAARFAEDELVYFVGFFWNCLGPEPDT